MEIQTRIEQKRGCGYRKPGGLYMVSSEPPQQCGVFPLPLTFCACCGAGIKPARGFTWIAGQALGPMPCKFMCEMPCAWKNKARYGLIWVGESFYKTPSAFLKEWNKAGISRRVGRIPRDFKVGETSILLAHRKAITVVAEEKTTHQAGAFAIFTPQAIEYIITGKESEAQLKRYVDRGFTLVKVIRDIDAQTHIEAHMQDFTITYQVETDGAPFGFPGESVKTKHTYDTMAETEAIAKENFMVKFPSWEFISIKQNFEKAKNNVNLNN